MRDRPDTNRYARHGRQRRTRHSGRLAGFGAWVGIASMLIGAGYAAAQDMSMAPQADMGPVDAGGPPVTSMGEGSFFSQDLGTTLRARFNTRSYGQDDDQDGNLDIGSMQVVSWDDAIAFFDGQVTLSDVQGIGFNVGVGYRWLSCLPYATDAERVTGVSLWGDGTSTQANNFFPQLGVSFESLGDSWDLRANGYIPIGQDNQIGNFVPTGAIGFQGNFISELAIATIDKSFYAADMEFARRVGHERDVWGFAGPYVLANDEDDTAGIRAGVRGYAYPDLLLQIAVTHDDIFATNTTFSLTWFIGRTRTNFHPGCGALDRFREPVMRNDYVALSQSTALGGTPLTDVDGNAFRVVHVDSHAPSGGDGTFERPLNNLDDINSHSQVRDIVFAHAESEFTGQEATLQAKQRFLGEGDGIEHTIVTQEKGTIPIPESSPGAADAPRPMILAALGDAVTVGDLNEVANFTIDGGTRAIVAGASGAGNPNLHDLTIRNTTGDAIVLSPFVRVDTNDVKTVAFNVTIRKVTLDNIGGKDISMDAFTNADVTDPNVTLQEAIALSDIDSNNGNGNGVLLKNTHSAGTFALTNYTNTDGTAGAMEGRLQFNDIAGDVTITNADVKGGAGYALSFLNVEATSAVSVTQLDYDGMAGAAGAVRMDTFDGTFTASNSTLQNGTLNGISILNGSDGSFNFQSTVTMTDLGNMAGARAFEIDGGLDKFTGSATVASAITNTLGRSVAIENMSGAGTAATFSGNITDTGEGIFVNNNTGGTILFLGNVSLTTEANTAILATMNTGADINFTGDTDITTTSGNGLEATGGGTLTVSNTNNSIKTDSGQIAKITDMTISNAGVNFGQVDRTQSAATNAVQLVTNTGGPILIGTVGDNAGDSGTIMGGTADAILVRNSANVTVSGIQINNGANTVSGVMVDKTNNNAMTVNLNDLELNGGDIGVEVAGGSTTGNLTMTINDTNINNSMVLGMAVSNVGAGTINVTNAKIDGDPATNPTAGGVRLVSNNATLTFDAATVIREWGGTDFDVFDGAGIVNMNGDITNASAVNPFDTTGHSINIQNVTAGTITFGTTNAVVDDNEGINVQSNTGGSINFLGTYNLDTTTNNAVTMTNNTGAAISIGQLDIVTTTGNGFVATGGGTLTVLGTGNKITTGNGRGLDIEDMTIGAVDFESVNVSDSPDNGIRLVNNTTGVITVGDTGNAAGNGGTVQNTDAAGIHVENSNVTLNGVTVQNAGDAAGENGVEISHTNSNTMNANLNRLTVNNATASRDGVVIDGTGGSGTFNANLQNLQVNVTGDGLTVNSGVTLTAGSTNDITSTTGVGLTLTGIAIGGGGANFNSVTVTGGATNGVFMQNVTGGQVQIGTVGGATDSGGALTTAGDAVVLSNVQNVDLRHLHIINASAGDGLDIDHTALATTIMDITIDDLDLDAASVNGVDVLAANGTNAFNLRLTNSALTDNVVMSHTSTGNFSLLVDNSDITTSGTTVAFSLAFSGSAQDGDVTIRNGSNFAAANASALAMTVNGTNANIEFALDAAMLSNNSATAETANIAVSGGATLNANVVNNTFNNSAAADKFQMSSDGSSTRINLDLDNNTANGIYELITTNKGAGFNFGVQDRDNTAANNTGTVTFNPIITDFEAIMGPVESPTVP